jgi:(E)-4-hydroxy-3-methyl-but-2-enyl pyrophosphate reductase
MKIAIARTAGFCMGVRRAVEMALDASNRTCGPICTYGPLIHNPQVLAVLEEKGISVINAIPDHGAGTAIIRAHGIPPAEREALKQAGFDVIDATCPKVIKVQSIIAKHARQGFAVIIIGDKAHPEVRGLLGYAGENGYVAENMDALAALPAFDRAIIVAQTTQNTEFFEAVKSWTRQHYPDYKVFDTICDSTENRQAEIKRLAAAVDAVVVVGGFDSGNTRRLYEIARETGKPAVQIETEGELDIQRLGNAEHIGVTAGASTPNWIIKRVFRELENRLIYREGPLRRWCHLLQRKLLLSNIYLALGAGCLTYAAARLQGLNPSMPAILTAMFYLLCMHTVNNLIDSTSDRYNDPDRGNFYQENRHLLWAMVVGSGIGGLTAAYRMGPLFVVLLVCMSLMGVIYMISLVPRMADAGIHPKIREIPGSKTVLVALAWGIVTSIVPAIDGFGSIRPETVPVFAWAVSLVFIRTAFFDILDMQGSRIAGKETIPILLGENRTMHLLKLLSVMAAGLISLSALAGWVSPLGFLLGLLPIFMLVFLFSYERRGFSPGLRQVFLMESHFILAGALAGLWAVLIL